MHKIIPFLLLSSLFFTDETLAAKKQFDVEKVSIAPLYQELIDKVEGVTCFMCLTEMSKKRSFYSCTVCNYPVACLKSEFKNMRRLLKKCARCSCDIEFVYWVKPKKRYLETIKIAANEDRK